MASLVVNWTQALQEESTPDAPAAVVAFDEAYYLRVRHDRSFVIGCLGFPYVHRHRIHDRACQSASLMHLPTQEEVYYEQELAKELFDPEKFSGVFTSGSSHPKWLDGPSGLTSDRYLPPPVALHQIRSHFAHIKWH